MKQDFLDEIYLKLLDALQHPEVHVERDRVGEFFSRLLRFWFVKLYARQHVFIGWFG